MEVAIAILLLGGVMYLHSRRKDKHTNPQAYTPYWKQKYGHLSPDERRREYRRRGKSPSGVIDGVYNDMYREEGRPYSDVERDWDADA